MTDVRIGMTNTTLAPCDCLKGLNDPCRPPEASASSCTFPLLKFHIFTVPSLAPVMSLRAEASKHMQLIFDVPCAPANLQ